MGRDRKELGDEHGYSPIFGCPPTRCADIPRRQPSQPLVGRSDRYVARMIRTPRIPSRPTDARAPFSRTWLVALLLMLLAIPRGQATARPLDDVRVPSIDDAIPAWLEARRWLDTGVIPESDAEDARLAIADLSAVGVQLRLDGRVVGRGVDPDGDAFAVRRAFGRALAQALGDRTIRLLPEPWRSTPGPRLCLEIEFAGPRQPLVGGTLAAAARRLRPGVDGVAVVRGEDVAFALPGRLLSTGTADGTGSMLIRLLDELGLPPQDLPELRRLDSVRLERFETLRLGQSAPDAMPGTRSRLGGLVPRDADLESTSHTLAGSLRARLGDWRPAEDPANPESARPWLGTFDPISGLHQPVEAPLADRLLALWALAERPGEMNTDLDITLPSDLDDDSISDMIVDLALLASTPTRPEAASAWLERSDSIDRSSSTVASMARHAAALGALPLELVSNERFDAAYDAVWSACGSLLDIHAAFDWLGLTERAWWRRHGEPGPRLESLRAARDALLARQINDPTSDLDGSIPLRSGAEEVSDARSLRLLLGMAALHEIPDSDLEGRDRAERGAVGLVRFVRQLQLTPEEAADLPEGRRAIGGIQAAPADPRQPLVATAMALIAVGILDDAPPAGFSPSSP